MSQIPYILTLVAGGPELDPKHLAAVAEYLEGHSGQACGAAHVLAVGKACDIPLPVKPEAAQMRVLRDLLAPEKVDVFITATEGRKKSLLLADMESTIISNEMLDEMAHELGPEGAAEISGITARAMRGELDFGAALEARVGMLKGLAADMIDSLRKKIAFNDGAKTLVATMKAHGAYCVVVTGGFTHFSGEVAADGGFDAHHANTLEWADGKLTGRVLPPILDRDAKLKFLHQYVEERKLSPDATIAIGDGANDLPMLQEAGLGIGYHPKPLLLNALDNCIVHGDLTAALYAQGYNEEDIIEN